MQRLGIGLTRLSDSKDIQMRTRLIESSINSDGAVFLDTSPLYSSGRSEIFAGNLKKSFGHSIFLASKYYPKNGQTALNVFKNVHTSINNMGLESIDLLQIHWPNPLCNLDEVLEGFKALKVDGLVKNFGLSNFCSAEVDEITRKSEVNFISHQNEFNFSVIKPVITDPERTVPIIYGALLQGRLAPSRFVCAKLEKIALLFGVSVPSLIIAYVFNKFPKSICIVKVSHDERLAQLQEGLNIELTPDSFAQLDCLLPNEPLYVDAEKILLRGDKIRAPYLSLEDALENKLDLIPCPLSLATRIRKYRIILPLKVFRSEDQFLIEDYDPFDQIKKFWAWKLAYPGKKVPVSIIDTGDHSL